MQFFNNLPTFHKTEKTYLYWDYDNTLIPLECKHDTMKKFKEFSSNFKDFTPRIYLGTQDTDECVKALKWPELRSKKEQDNMADMLILCDMFIDMHEWIKNGNSPRSLRMILLSGDGDFDAATNYIKKQDVEMMVFTKGEIKTTNHYSFYDMIDYCEKKTEITPFYKQKPSQIESSVHIFVSNGYSMDDDYNFRKLCRLSGRANDVEWENTKDLIRNHPSALIHKQRSDKNKRTFLKIHEVRRVISECSRGDIKRKGLFSMGKFISQYCDFSLKCIQEIIRFLIKNDLMTKNSTQVILRRFTFDDQLVYDAYLFQAEVKHVTYTMNDLISENSFIQFERIMRETNDSFKIQSESNDLFGTSCDDYTQNSVEMGSLTNMIEEGEANMFVKNEKLPVLPFLPLPPVMPSFPQVPNIPSIPWLPNLPRLPSLPNFNNVINNNVTVNGVKLPFINGIDININCNNHLYNVRNDGISSANIPPVVSKEDEECQKRMLDAMRERQEKMREEREKNGVTAETQTISPVRVNGKQSVFIDQMEELLARALNNDEKAYSILSGEHANIVDSVLRGSIKMKSTIINEVESSGFSSSEGRTVALEYSKPMMQYISQVGKTDYPAYNIFPIGPEHNRLYICAMKVHIGGRTYVKCARANKIKESEKICAKIMCDLLLENHPRLRTLSYHLE